MDNFSHMRGGATKNTRPVRAARNEGTNTSQNPFSGTQPTPDKSKTYSTIQNSTSYPP